MPTQVEPLSLAIDRDDDLPVGVQLAWKHPRRLIASGALAPGDRLPERARARRASRRQRQHRPSRLRRLERDGLIVSRHGLGTFVADDVPVSAEVERIAAERRRRGPPRPGVDAPRRRARDLRRRRVGGDEGCTTASFPTSAPRPTRRPPVASCAARSRASRPSWRPIPSRALEASRHPPAPAAEGPRRRLRRARGDPRRADAAPEARRASAAEQRGDRQERAQLQPRGDDRATLSATASSGSRTRIAAIPGCGETRVGPALRPDRRRRRLVAGEALVRVPIAMVRAAADRTFLPAKSLFEQVGNMLILTGKTIVAAVKPALPLRGRVHRPVPLRPAALLVPDDGLDDRRELRRPGPAGRELPDPVRQPSTAWAASSSSPRSASSRPFVTAIIVAGVAGTAITADLGARKIREELDALQVLGVDPIKNLVVPRFLALMLITGLLDVYAMLFGISGGLFAEIAYGQPLGGFFATLFTNASVTDLWGVAAQVHDVRGDRRDRLLLQGMNASGGAEGVGRAVNEAVVIAFLGVFAFNYVFTQTLLATHPEISQIK